MTALLARPASTSHWGSMPGWNIVADMTPPELINLRRIAVLRRRIVIGLVVVAALCAAGYTYASMQNHTAADDAALASSQTFDLTRSAAKYSGITRIESAVDTVRGQVATVMTPDVDVTQAIAAMRHALPRTMSIQNLALTLSAAGPTNDSVGLDASGHVVIGKVTISGSGRTLDDLPNFVDRLVAIRGLVNVVPTSNQVASKVAQFSLSVDLTDQLYTHRYDVTSTGGR
jgi:hypothetical protein